MLDKPTRGRRRLQMLHDRYATLNQAAEERKGWRYSGIMSETCSTEED